MKQFHEWRGRWIAPAGLRHKAEHAPAPRLGRSFTLTQRPGKAELFLASGGYHELYVNGQRPDDRVLAPAPTQFDKHVHYVVYDVAGLLHAGENRIEIWLGNGWYDCGTATRWNTQSAPWRDTVKCCAELWCDGACVLTSGKDWQWATTPIVFNELRNGEIFDARLENTPPEWKPVTVTPSPGGILIRESAPPCRITQMLEPVKVTRLSALQSVYDFGINLSGVCEIELSGPAGAEALLEYAESVHENGDIDVGYFEHFILSGPFQADRCILKGEGVERFRARFAYHGFRYMRLFLWDKRVTVHAVRACFLHTDFADAGDFQCSDATLTSLQKMTRQSFLSNFVGIPTDCPHREKNGWTGDALLAAETGLWNFDCADGCADFLRTVADTQRPSGQLPGVAPTGGFGYNGWSGPAWDSILFEYPYQIYRFTGKDAPIREHFDAMVRYLDFCASMADEAGLVEFGLGDWCHANRNDDVPTRFVVSAYYCGDLHRMAEFARLLGRDCAEYARRSETVRAALWSEFCTSDNLTVLGGLLYWHIVPENARAATAERLAQAVRRVHHRSWFGMHGAKWVPRALAANGFADDALEVLTQPEFPGWGHWVQCGETTLCESWNRAQSRNHILFGDVSAWSFEYLGGIAPQFDAPGFRRFTFAPCFPRKLERFAANHRTPQGWIRTEWERSANGRIAVRLTVPEGCEAEVQLPGVEKSIRSAGTHTF